MTSEVWLDAWQKRFENLIELALQPFDSAYQQSHLLLAAVKARVNRVEARVNHAKASVNGVEASVI
mgnify:CR=1 FL=1